MQTEKTDRLYTYEDYLKIDDDNQYELIGGELILVPRPRPKHQKTAGRIYTKFENFLKQNAFGEVIYEVDVYLSGEVVSPDIIFISKDRLNIIGELNIQGAPDLVVEILSQSTVKLDRVKKSRLYYEYGVKEYWIVDPDHKIIEVFMPGEKNWNLFQAYNMDETLISPLLNGLEIQLKEIF